MPARALFPAAPAIAPRRVRLAIVRQPEPECGYCGETSIDLVAVEGRDDSVGYVEVLDLCPRCRHERRW